MSVFGHVCMHGYGCHQSLFHHMPFKRKSNIVKSEWPALAITTKLHSSQEGLAFSYVSAGSKFLPLRLTLSSSLIRKTFSLSVWPLLKPCCNQWSFISNFIWKLLQKRRKDTKYHRQSKYFQCQNLLIAASQVFVILAIFFGPLSASSLDLHKENGGHVLSLEKRDTNYLPKPLSYPNCSEDFDCPEDQVCKFLHQSLLVIQEPQVGECSCSRYRKIRGRHITSVNRDLIDERNQFVVWKWRCYEKVGELHGNCAVSRQCQTDRDPYRHCNPVTRRCKCDFGYAPITIESDEFEFEHICKQVNMAHAYHSDSFSGIHESTSYYPFNATSKARHNEKSVSKEKQRDMTIKRIISQLNSSINSNSGYEHYPAAPNDFYNHTLSNSTTFGYNHNSDHRYTQLSNVMYVGLAMMCLLSFGLVGLFYMRSLKDKRRSQAAIRSLLDLMTESNREQSASCGMGGGTPIASVGISRTEYSLNGTSLKGDSNKQPTYIHNQMNESVNIGSDTMRSFDSSQISCSQQDSSEPKENIHTFETSSELIAYRGINLKRESLTYANESRIHLPSLEDESGQPFATFPAPHLSIPILPPIKSNGEKNNRSGHDAYATLKRPRPYTSLKRGENAASQLPSSSDLKAISNSLSMDRAKCRDRDGVISAASFPDDDPYQISFENDQRTITNDIDLWSKTDQKTNHENLRNNNQLVMDEAEGTAKHNYGINLLEELDATHQANTDESHSSSQRESESASSSYSLEFLDSTGLGSTRM